MSKAKLVLVFSLSWLPGAWIGCNGPLTPQARQLLQSGYDHFAEGRYHPAIKQLDAFLVDNAGSSRADEAFYLRGMAKVRTKDFPTAKADLNEAIGRTGNGQLRAKARVALGDLAYDSGDMALAENMYRQALADIERGAKPGGHAHYRLGCVLQRQGRWQDADVQFDRVVYLFAGTEIARHASRRTHCVAWTIQAGAFRKEAPANLAAKRCDSKMLPTAVKPVISGGRPLFILALGRFATYEQAVAALKQANSLPKDAFVAPTR